MNMTTENDTSTANDYVYEMRAIMLHSKRDAPRIFGFEGDDGYARATIAILRERAEDGYWYGERPENVSEKFIPPTPESVLNDAFLASYNLTDEEINTLPEALRTGIKNERVKATNLYEGYVEEAKQEHWFWHNLAKLLDSPESEAIKMGTRRRMYVNSDRTEFIPLGMELLKSRKSYEYEGFELIIMDVHTESKVVYEDETPAEGTAK